MFSKKYFGNTYFASTYFGPERIFVEIIRFTLFIMKKIGFSVEQ